MFQLLRHQQLGDVLFFKEFPKMAEQAVKDNIALRVASFLTEHFPVQEKESLFPEHRTFEMIFMAGTVEDYRELIKSFRQCVECIDTAMMFSPPPLPITWFEEAKLLLLKLTQKPTANEKDNNSPVHGSTTDNQTLPGTTPGG